jgi:homoprotocatechuate degradation regulator HpaR
MADPTRPVFDQLLPMSLLRAREIVVQQFRPLLRRHALNDQQWRVLRVLAEMPDVTTTRLAQEAAVLSPSLSRMLPAMESRGLLRRKPSPTDQRHSLVALEPAGRQLFEQVAVEVAAIYAQMARDFGTERLDRLHAELEALRLALCGRPRNKTPHGP